MQSYSSKSQAQKIQKHTEQISGEGKGRALWSNHLQPKTSSAQKSFRLKPRSPVQEGQRPPAQLTGTWAVTPQLRSRRRNLQPPARCCWAGLRPRKHRLRASRSSPRPLRLERQPAGVWGARQRRPYSQPGHGTGRHRNCAAASRWTRGKRQAPGAAGERPARCRRQRPPGPSAALLASPR